MHLNGDTKENSNKTNHSISELFEKTNFLFNFPKKFKNSQSYLSKYQKKKKIKGDFSSNDPKLPSKQKINVKKDEIKVPVSERVKIEQSSPRNQSEKKKSYLNRFLEEISKQEKLNKEIVMKNNQKHKMNTRLVDTNLKFQKRCPFECSDSSRPVDRRFF